MRIVCFVCGSVDVHQQWCSARPGGPVQDAEPLAVQQPFSAEEGTVRIRDEDLHRKVDALAAAVAALTERIATLLGER